MKRTWKAAAATGVALGFVSGRLTAQPPEVAQAPRAPQLALSAKQKQFLGDLNAAMR
jgi:hypothetical protein